jgi:hypothetical protein
MNQAVLVIEKPIGPLHDIARRSNRARIEWHSSGHHNASYNTQEFDFVQLFEHLYLVDMFATDANESRV